MIRSATQSDVAQIVALGAAFHSQSAWAEIVPFDARAFARTVKEWVRSGTVRVFVSDNGFLVVAASPLYFSPEPVAYEVLFYAPDGRGDDLRQVAEAWAKSNGIKCVLMGTHTTRVEAMKRWFRLKGYRFFGMTFLKVM